MASMTSTIWAGLAEQGRLGHLQVQSRRCARPTRGSSRSMSWEYPGRVRVTVERLTATVRRLGQPVQRVQARRSMTRSMSADERAELGDRDEVRRAGRCCRRARSIRGRGSRSPATCPGRQVHDRLEVGHEAVVLERLADPALDVEPMPGLVGHGGVGEHVPVAAVGLRLAHGGAGIAGELLAVGRAVADGDADAHGRLDDARHRTRRAPWPPARMRSRPAPRPRRRWRGRGATTRNSTPVPRPRRSGLPIASAIRVAMAVRTRSPAAWV